MIKTLFSLSLCLLITPAIFSQFSSFEKKNKFGINYEVKLIYKAKFDSVKTDDKDIVTAYKKNKVFYYNSSAEKVYKTSIEYGSCFQNEFAILKDKKGKFGAINKEGELIVSKLYKERPTYYGNLLFVPGIIKNSLYSSEKKLNDKVDSLEWFHQWVIVHAWQKVKHTYTKKHFLRRDEKIVEYIKTPHQDLYNPYSKVKLDGAINKIVDLGDFVLLQKPKYPDAIRSTTTNFYNSKVSNVIEIDSNYISFNSEKSLHLLDRKKSEVILTKKLESYRINPNTIYGIKSAEDAISDISIYTKEGVLLKDSIRHIKEISKGRSVFVVDSLQFIGTEEGERLSSEYFAFGDEKNGYRIVFKGYTYGFINDSTYTSLNINFPLIILEYQGSYGRRRGFIGSLIRGVGNFGRRLVGKPSKGNSVYIGGTSGGSTLFEAGHHFQDGLSKVCLYGYNEQNQYDSVLFIKSKYVLKYNFVDTVGNFLNKRKYAETGEFKNGRVWVKDGNFYFIIDKNGKKINRKKYSQLQEIENGYFTASYRGIDYILNDLFEEVHSCNCFRIDFDGKNFTNTQMGEAEIIYTIPE